MFLTVMWSALLGAGSHQLPNLKVDSMSAIVMTLSSPVCRVGLPVNLIESVAHERGEIEGYRHSVVQVGTIDPRTGELTLFAAGQFCPDSTDELFSGLPSASSSSHGSRLKNVPGGLGIEYRVVPRQPGVYLLSCEWVRRSDELNRRSVPIVLTVLPAQSR